MQDNAQGASVPEDFTAFETYMRQTPEERETATPEAVAAPAAADTEQDPPAETAPESGTDDTQDEPGSKGKGVQKKIDKLTKKAGELERQNQELQRRLEEKEQGSRPAEKVAPPQQQQVEGEPQLETFDSYQEYYKALVDFRLDQRERSKAAQAVQKTAADSWKTREDAARTAHADYDEALEEVEIPNTPAVPALQKALAADEHGAELLYRLAKSPDDLKRITSLSPEAALLELGKFAAKTAPAAANPEKPIRKETNVPPPPRRVDGTFAPTKAVDDPEIPFDEFEKRQRARQR